MAPFQQPGWPASRYLVAWLAGAFAGLNGLLDSVGFLGAWRLRGRWAAFRLHPRSTCPGLPFQRYEMAVFIFHKVRVVFFPLACIRKAAPQDLDWFSLLRGERSVVSTAT